MNGVNPWKLSKRREFFRDSIRYAALGVLVVLSAALTRGGARRLPGQRCVNRGICGGCSAFSQCGLPQALSAKRARIEGRS